MLTSSKGSVYNLLPTTCNIGSKKTSFQEGRQGAENWPPQVNLIEAKQESAKEMLCSYLRLHTLLRQKEEKDAESGG